MPIFGKKDKQGNLACNFSHADGIASMPQGIAVCVTQEDSESRLSVSMRFSKQPPIYIKYDQISNVDFIDEKQIKESSKSVIGRATIGGLFLGPLGAIVGGMSGTGTKKKVETKYFFIINYHPTNEPDETKIISFEIVGASLHWSNFIKELRSKIHTLETHQPQYL
jgi:hypothetical protein